MWLPWSDTAESAATWSNFWFWFGIGCLLLLGVSETISHLYTLRKDELVASTEGKRIAGDQKRNEDVEKRYTGEIGSLKGQLTEAQKKLSEVQQRQVDRHLSEAQKQAILAAISPYPGQKVDLVTVMNDGEAIRYANEFFDIFRSAKWNVPGLVQAAFIGDVRDITCLVSPAWGQRGEVPIGAGAFMMAMIKLGLIKEGKSDASVTGDTLKIVIGRKPTS